MLLKRRAIVYAVVQKYICNIYIIYSTSPHESIKKNVMYDIYAACTYYTHNILCYSRNIYAALSYIPAVRRIIYYNIG